MSTVIAIVWQPLYGGFVMPYVRQLVKIGPNGAYTQDDLDLYERCRTQREACRPLDCDAGAVCWVRAGPPAIGSAPSCRCLGCGGSPLVMPGDRAGGHYPPYPRG